MSAALSTIDSKHLVVTLLVLGSVAAGPRLTAQTGEPKLAARVDSLFVQWDKPDSPGCALGVVKDAKFVYKRGYGMANLEHHIPISASTVFRIGSTSKQFTAMIIALLAREGKLALDDDIRKYLPEMPAYGWPITVRHLIHHTSGIRDYLTLMSLAGMRDDDYYTDEEVLDLLARQRELNFKPGDEFLYSNSGYFLLSIIAKRATGKSLRALAEEMIFRPLGMKHTHFHDDHTAIVENRASGYSPKDGGGFKLSMTTLDMIGDGGVFTSVEDLFLWDRNFYHNRLGGKDLINQILTPATLNSGEKLDYAFGLTVSEYKGLKMISHGGAFVGFRAEMVRFPEQEFSVICLCNLSNINPSRLARRVADIYLGGQFGLENGKANPVPVDTIHPVNLSEAELMEKTGAFRNRETGVIWKLSAKGGKLVVEASGRSFQLVPLSKTRFRTVKAPLDIVVRFDKRSQLPLLHVEFEGRPPARFEQVQLVHPTPGQLSQYVGRYFSQELLVAYDVVLDGGKLYLRHENRHKHSPSKPLEPTLLDSFSVSGLDLSFHRNKEGYAAGFTLSAGRVKNIRFVRKQAE